MWRALMEQGASPCGLGARDVLRLEAGLPLHGNDIDPTTTPIEAGLDRFAKLDHDFVGADVIGRQLEEGVPRRLVGLNVEGRSIARNGYPLMWEGKVVGTVTSGTHSPTLGRVIANGISGRRHRGLRAGKSLLTYVVNSHRRKWWDMPFYSRGRLKMNPTDRKYSKEHEWVKLESGTTGVVGVTHYAQDQLGDVVFLDLPSPGARLEQFGKFGEIESVKAVNDLFSPVSGELLETNHEAADSPEMVNDDPYGKGWLLRVDLSDPSELDGLLTAGEYEDLLAEPSD